MSRFILLGQAGTEDLLLVDTQAMTITTIDKAAVDPTIAGLRASGVALAKGVDVAIAIDVREQAVGRFFFEGGGSV